MAKLIDGKAISQAIRDEVRDEISAGGMKPSLAVVLVGNDPASAVYVRNKKKACEYCGIRSVSYELPEDTTEEKLLSLIDELNNDPEINGILVQLPVPKTINEDHVIEAISPMKDVDGFSKASVGALSIGDKGFVSCTPAGIIELLKRSDIDIDGKRCVVLGRSNIVGKPAAMLLLRENGTVTVTHSHTKDLALITREADILVVAIGRPEFITAEYVKPGATVIDVGIHRLDPEKNDGKKLCGDVKFDEVEPVAGSITPVPGGVGPMTIAMLMKNTVAAYKMQH